MVEQYFIPKRIWQTWKTHDVPQQWKAAQLSIISMNPGYEYTLLSDEDNLNIVKTYFPDFLPFFLNFKYPIQRADAIRYIILYLYGGIYIDLDFEALKPFGDIILNKPIGLPINHNKIISYVTNYIMVSVKGCKFWLECIDEMKKTNLALGKHLHVYVTTGPFMLTNVYKRNKDKIEIIEFNVPCSICEVKNCKYDKRYYLRGIKGQSWIGYDTVLYNFLYCNRLIISICIILILTYVIVRIFILKYS